MLVHRCVFVPQQATKRVLDDNRHRQNCDERQRTGHAFRPTSQLRCVPGLAGPAGQQSHKTNHPCSKLAVDHCQSPGIQSNTAATQQSLCDHA